MTTTQSKTQTFDLHFKWTVSRGRDTYGYNVCTLLVDGKKSGSCKGGGYDMQGTSFAQWLENNFQVELCTLMADHLDSLAFNDNARTYLNSKNQKVRSNPGPGFYGMTLNVNDTTNEGRVRLDGGCGMGSMEQIANAIDIRLQWLKHSDQFKNSTFYTATFNPA